MGHIWFFTALMFFPLNVFAKTQGVCAYDYAVKFSPAVSKLPVTDKVKHCTISCQIAIHCPDVETFYLGALKEVMDIFDPHHHAEWKDLTADAAGIRVRREKNITKEADCLTACKLIRFK